jgi:hypothetical protein
MATQQNILLEMVRTMVILVDKDEYVLVRQCWTSRRVRGKVRVESLGEMTPKREGIV